MICGESSINCLSNIDDIISHLCKQGGAFLVFVKALREVLSTRKINDLFFYSQFTILILILLRFHQVSWCFIKNNLAWLTISMHSAKWFVRGLVTESNISYCCLRVHIFTTALYYKPLITQTYNQLQYTVVEPPRKKHVFGPPSPPSHASPNKTSIPCFLSFFLFSLHLYPCLRHAFLCSRSSLP